MKIIHVVNDKGGASGMLPRLLTFQQAKEYLQIGKDSLLDLIHSGQLKAFKLKGSWRISEDDLKEYIDSLRRQAV
jgi:excisionase family DNA binding protein